MPEASPTETRPPARVKAHGSALELAARIRSGEISAQEVVEAHIRRVEAVNARLNAVVVPLYDEARAGARAADEARARGDALAALHGVPVTIKESLDIAGTATTAGIPARAGHRAPADNVLVARLKRAGAIVLGKTNVPQLLLYHETDNPLYGRAVNPWNPTRAPGGSSGGEAAIIAAGGSVLGIGSDIGGSLRVPAHCCGIHALKPTTGRLPVKDSVDEWLLPGQEGVVAQPGPLARTVADLELALRILVGDAPAAPTLAPAPLGDPATVALRRLRIGMYTDDGYFPAAPALRRAVSEAAQALRDAGAEVVEFAPPDVMQAIRLYFRLLSADGAAGARRLLTGSRIDRRIKGLLQIARTPTALRRPLRAALAALGQPRLAALFRDVGGVSTRRYWDAVAERSAYQERFYRALDGARVDALICPPHALPALTHGASYWLAAAGSYAMLYNLLGMPAGVVAATRVRAGEESDRAASRDIVERAARRVEQGSAGLPIGVQVAARHWREDVALAVMGVLEAAFGRGPDYPADPPL